MKKYIKKTIGVILVMFFLPIICLCVALIRNEPWYLGFIMGFIYDVVLVLLGLFFAFILWLFE